MVKKLLKNEGVGGFYKGTLTPLVGVGACVSIQFGVNEFMKRTFNAQNAKNGKADSPLSHSQFYVSGMAAGIANGFLASPIEHIRIRLQTQTSTTHKLYNGPIDTIKKIYAGSGVKGIFRGLVPTQIREGHGMGAYFLAFEALVEHDMSSNKIERKDIPGWRLCLYGACAGYAMWFTSYPIDVVKSKLQTDSLDPAKQQYKGMLDCFSKIYATNGIKGFFRGFVPTILRAAPVNACTFFTFELTIRYLG